MNWKDRTTCVLFGDGAGAVVLEAVEGQGTTADRGIPRDRLNWTGALQGQPRRWRHLDRATGTP